MLCILGDSDITDVQNSLNKLNEKINFLENSIYVNANSNKQKLKEDITKLNKRKIFYLKQQTESTESVVIVLFTLYYILLAILAFVYIQKKLYTSLYSIGIFLALAILPVVINDIVNSIISIFNQIYSLSLVNEYRGLYKNELKNIIYQIGFEKFRTI